MVKRARGRLDGGRQRGSAREVKRWRDRRTSFNITAPSGTTLVGNCAEWIVETPSVGGQPTTLPDYGVVYFDDGLSSQKAGLAYANLGTPITLVDAANKALSTPTLEKSELIKLTYNDV